MVIWLIWLLFCAPLSKSFSFVQNVITACERMGFYCVPILTITITVFEFKFLLLLPVFYLSGHKIYCFLLPFLMIRVTVLQLQFRGRSRKFSSIFRTANTMFHKSWKCMWIKTIFWIKFFVVQKIHERPINRLLLIDFGDGSSQSRVFHSYEDVTITGDGLQILTLTKHS